MQLRNLQRITDHVYGLRLVQIFGPLHVESAGFYNLKNWMSVPYSSAVEVDPETNTAISWASRQLTIIQNNLFLRYFSLILLAQFLSVSLLFVMYIICMALPTRVKTGNWAGFNYNILVHLNLAYRRGGLRVGGCASKSIKDDGVLPLFFPQ